MWFVRELNVKEGLGDPISPSAGVSRHHPQEVSQDECKAPAKFFRRDRQSLLGD